ncbi:MAG: Cro/Cl family transcriptional regulator [Gammaproteobacteria bacterium]|nr:Cro/Cl family transcriptional regulator [Gammaproteobacteria bacterium]
MKENPSIKIRVDDAVRLFGSKAELARRLGVTAQALTKWHDYLPELRAYQFRDKHPVEAEILIRQASSGTKQ